MPRLHLSSLVCCLALVCAAPVAAQSHGVISDLSAVGTDEGLCEHEVPAQVCVLCHPELEARFREVGDWCRPHRVPESQCHRCHPDLDFSPLPAIPDGADVAVLDDAQALEGLAAHAVAGRVTVFDFTADWCAPCQNLERHLRGLLGASDDLAVRWIDVTAWEGPVFNTYLRTVPSLPYVQVYAPDGTLVGELAGFELSELDALIEQARDAAE